MNTVVDVLRLVPPAGLVVIVLAVAVLVALVVGVGNHDQ